MNTVNVTLDENWQVLNGNVDAFTIQNVSGSNIEFIASNDATTAPTLSRGHILPPNYVIDHNGFGGSYIWARVPSGNTNPTGAYVVVSE